MNRFICLLMACSLLACRSDDKTTSAMNEERCIGIENSKIALVFDKNTGALTQLTNKITGDNYLKNPKGGNIFRLFVNTTSMPALSACPHNDNYGGSMIDTSTEYNVETLEMKEIVIRRSGKGIFIKLHYPVSTVFFPLPSCPPLPVINSSEIAGSFPSTIAINVTLVAPWNPESERKNISSIAIRSPGFKVKKKSVNGNEVLLDLDISASIKSNNYFFQVGGSCLPGKRWFLVK